MCQFHLFSLNVELWSGFALSTQLGSDSNFYTHSSPLISDNLVSVGVPYSLMGRFFETKGGAAGFTLAVTIKVGAVSKGTPKRHP